jgi:hypothetical protein
MIIPCLVFLKSKCNNKVNILMGKLKAMMRRVNQVFSFTESFGS